MARSHPTPGRLVLLVVVTALPATFSRAADPVYWRTDYHAARKEAQEKGVPLLVEIGTEHCIYCRKMEATTFRDPAVAALVNTKFVPLRVDANAEPELVKALRVQMYPTTVLAGPDGKIHAYLQGYVGADQFTDQANRAVAAVAGPRTTVVAVADPVAEAKPSGPLKRALTEAKDLAVRAVRGRRVPAEGEQEAGDKLARALTLADAGDSVAAAEVFAEVARRYEGTRAGGEAVARLVLVAAPKPSPATDLLATARQDLKAGRLADGLERCDRLKADHPDAPEAREAGILADEVRTDPKRLAAAADQLAERTAAVYLALADAHISKNQPREAAGFLAKVVRVAPNSRQADAAQERLARLPADAVTIPAGYERGR